MTSDSIIKLAYGVGCLHTLQQWRVDPNEFIKVAQASPDDALRGAAGVVAATLDSFHTAPETSEKLASVIFQPEKTAAKGMELGRDMLEQIGGLLGKAKGRAADFGEAAQESFNAAKKISPGLEDAANPKFLDRGQSLRAGIPENPLQAAEQVALGNAWGKDRLGAMLGTSAGGATALPGDLHRLLRTGTLW